MPNPGPIFVTVANAQTVSSAFVLPRGDRPLVIVCPSNGTAAQVQLQFTTTSGTAPFGTSARVDGSGLLFNVFSGAGDAWGYHPAPPSPYGRVSLSAAPSAVMTYTILEKLPGV